MPELVLDMDALATELSWDSELELDEFELPLPPTINEFQSCARTATGRGGARSAEAESGPTKGMKP